MKQTVRIIGGLYRGKKLHFPAVEGLRPTPDRVRETLFNWLMNDIQDARCLDAFAGSGALGLEAFSRGAAQIVFLEQSAAAHGNLKQIIQQFASPKLQLIRTETRKYLLSCEAQFDVIFLDPPFAHNLLPECLSIIAEKKLLIDGGLLYIEAPSMVDIDPKHWQQLKLKQSGQVVYGLFEKRKGIDKERGSCFNQTNTTKR